MTRYRLAVCFSYKQYEGIEDGVCVVRFDDKWYRDRDEFFKKARLDERKLTSIHDYLYGFEVNML